MIRKISKKKILLTMSVSLIFLNDFLTDDMVFVVEVILLLLMTKVRISKNIVAFFSFLLIHGLIGVLAGTNNFWILLQQIIAIGVNLVFYYTIINKNNYIEAIKIYIGFSTPIAALAIAQQIAFYLDIPLIYDLRWLNARMSPVERTFYRSAAIFSEPGGCGLVLMPVMFLSMYYFIGKSRQQCRTLTNSIKSVVILTGFVCTFSASAFVGVPFAFILILFEYKINYKQIIVIALAIIAVVAAYSLAEPIRMRVDDSVQLFFGNNIRKDVNISTQTLYINYRVALKSLVGTFGLGSGLGGYKTMYDKYVGSIATSNVGLLLNSTDGNSLLFRTTGDLGLFGLFGIAAFLLYFRVRETNSVARIISGMCFVEFIIRLLRSGHYFNYGFLFFVVVYMVAGSSERAYSERKERLRPTMHSNMEGKNENLRYNGYI